MLIPEAMVRRALDTVPRAFDLYGRAGEAAVRYGQGVVHFDPGSSGVAVLDPDTLDTRQSQAADLVRITRVADSLPAYDAVSTAVVAHDVPTEIGDLYRLFLVMLHSSKPVVTGAFTPRGSAVMIDLLALDSGGREALAEKPRAVFDVCPSPPLTWSEFACRNVMDLGPGARAGRAHLDAAGRRGRPGDAGRVHRPARRGDAGRRRPAPAGRGRFAHRLGWSADDRGHADGLHADGGDRDGDDRRGVRRGRQVAGHADARVPGRDGLEGDRRAGRARDRDDGAGRRPWPGST